jgi:ribosome-associated heat shock protein Hsp15
MFCFRSVSLSVNFLFAEKKAFSLFCKIRMEKVRLDKWLWAVRIFKTRALASEACRKGWVIVNTWAAKPSKEIGEGDEVTVRKMPVIYNFVVKKTVENRLSAKLVPDYLEDRTSVQELDKLKVKDTFFARRDRGTGRPTKKERRELDDLSDNFRK